MPRARFTARQQPSLSTTSMPGMEPMMSFDRLIDFYAEAIADIVTYTGADQELATTVAAAIGSGNLDLARPLLAADQPFRLRPALSDLLAQTAGLTAELRQLEFVDPNLFERAANAMYRLGVFAESEELLPVAYNFYEAAYHFLSVAGLPALEAAKKIRLLSNPDNVDQHHGAIWRLAIELLRNALDTKANWLDALDAIELALVCPIPLKSLQEQVLAQMNQQVSRASDTPIEELAAIFLVQAPPEFIDSTRRRKGLEAMVTHRFKARTHELTDAQLEIFANSEAQALFDDMRLKFLPNTVDYPTMDYIDVTLRHRNLESAVPMGRSLIADVDRTGNLLLDLAHEITHALTLQGPIGFEQAAYRAATQYLELFLIEDRNDAASTPQFAAAETVPTTPIAAAAARQQFDIARAGVVARDIWRSWLEGVSMYVELLCDPKTDPNEILSVHECIRLLIDYGVSPHDGEDKDAFAERVAKTMSQEFEEAYSLALHSKSALRQQAYCKGTADADERDVYLIGYLVVRSVVARWETTVGERIEPVRAARLLLNATQNGPYQTAMPTLELDYQAEAYTAAHLQWLKELAALPREVLLDFWAPVDSSAAGVQWGWKDGIPFRLHENLERGEQVVQAFFKKLYAAMHTMATIELAGEPPQRIEPDSSILEAMLLRFLDLNALLPIGRDNPRLIFPNIENVIGLAPRTYQGETSDGAAAEFQPRYSPRYFGGAPEDNLSHLCGRLGTARTTATRIIDLRGNPELHRYARNSYRCFFLGDRWSYIATGLGHKDISKQDKDFTELLRDRTVDNVPFADEANTLRSLKFLEDRLRASRLCPASDCVAPRLALVVAAQSAALAFGFTDGPAFEECYRYGMQARLHRYALGHYLHATGFAKEFAPDPAFAELKITSRICSRMSMSGITPFGEHP